MEAHWLFDMPYEQISVVVHPQSIIHSMVEFVDDSIKMQASLPSMHLPIQYALSYPERLDRAGTALARELRWPEVARLDFEDVDFSRFPCLKLAVEAGRRGGTAPAALVAADEAAVALFLGGHIQLTDIADALARVVEVHEFTSEPSLTDVLETSRWAQEEVLRLFGQPVPERITERYGES
jgi:1-deoxy-D-xylulose-5-phosphate reductoisomerase